MDDTLTREQLEGRLSLLQGKIRSTVGSLEKEPISLNVFSSFERDIEGNLEELEGVSRSLEEQLAAEEEAELLTELFETSFRFKREVRNRLESLRAVSVGDTPGAPREERGPPNMEPTGSFPFNPTAHSSFSIEPFKIKLKGPHFSGKDFEKNKRGFKDFLTKFENCAVSIPSASGKLHFLRCSLEGRALQLIDHLSVTEDSYPVALKLLKEQYLDEEEIRGEIIQGILDFHLENPRDLVELKDFIMKTQADIWELRASYSCDLYDDRSAGAIIISQVLFAKLPPNVKGELIRISGKTYPTLSAILLKTPQIVKQFLVIRKPVQNPVFKPRPPPRFRNEKDEECHSSLKAFNAKVESRPQKCELCKRGEHSAEDCPHYTSHEARITRCKELWLCFRCLKKTHRGNICPLRTTRDGNCSSCTVKGHITAMCPTRTGKVCVDTCLHTNDYQYSFLSPVISVVVVRGGRRVEINCLLDTGSQRTYLDTSVLERLNCLSTAKKSRLEVKTFLGTETRPFKEALVDLLLVPGKVHPLQIFSSKLNLSYNLLELPQITKNLKRHRLATKYNSRDGFIKIEGLLGIDAIQFLEPFKIVPCMYGAAFSTPRGLIPFGNSRCFLYENQLKTRNKQNGGAKINFMRNEDKSAQARSVQPDPGKQASIPKPPQRNVDSTLSNQDKKKLRPPDRKNIDIHLNRIKLKEKELKSFNCESESIRGERKTLQPNRYVLNEKKKKNNLELKTLREEILVKNNNLSKLESGLTYKNEHKMNEAIKKLEAHLSCNNFNIREEKKIVAEIDSLKRSKKSLVNYLAQKKEIDELRQLKKRRETEQYHRQVSKLISEEDEMKSKLSDLHTKIENLHFELNDLNEQKKVLLSDYKRREKDHNVMKDAIRKKNRQNTKHKEEEKQLFNREDLLVVCTPEEEYIQNCNTLIRYLQHFPVGEHGQASRQAAAPVEEKAAAASLGPVPEIQGDHGATYVLLKKNEECEDLFFGAGRRQNKKSKKGRKFSATKPLTHSPQVFAQFANLQMSAPAGFAEILPALKQLEDKKKYFESLSQQRRGENLICPCRARNEAHAEPDDVCLSDSGYSADGSAACEFSRQVSHTESTDGGSSNVNLLEIINLMQADSVHNNQSPPPAPASSSSSSDDDDDDDDDDEEDESDDDDDDDNIIQEVGKNLKNSDTSNSLHESDQSRLLLKHCDTVEAAATLDGRVTATPLLCKIQPDILPAAKLGTTHLKVAPVISHNSCADEMPGCEELLQKQKTDEIIITNGDDKRNSCSSSSSSSSNCNDDLSEKAARDFRALVYVARSKRVKNFPPTTDISCDLKGMEYEALTSPSGLRFPSRTVARPSASCESSSDDEDKNVNAEEEECEEMEYPAAQAEDEEEEEDEEENEEEEEERDDEIERRKDEDEITDNSYSEKDNEKSAPARGSDEGDNTDDSDNDKILEDEERGFMNDVL